MRIGRIKRPSIYNLLGFLLIVSIWAFNEEKYITYPIKIAFILAFGFYWVKNHRGVINKYQAWCIAMCILSGLAALNSSNISGVINIFINVIQVFLIAFVLSGYLSTIEDIRRYLKLFVIGGFVLMLRLLITTPLSVWLSFNRIGDAIGYNANDVGNKAAIAAIIALCLFRDKGETRKTLYFVMFLAMSLIVVFSGSRKALLAIVVAVTLIYTIGLNNKKKMVFTIVGIFIALWSVYYFLMHNEVLYMTMGRRIESMMNVLLHGASEASSIDLREKYMQLAWGYIKESPLTGIGLGGFSVKSGLGTYCHCDYLEVMCSYGVPVAIVYYFPALRMLFRSLKAHDKDTIDYTLLIICVVMLLSFMTMVMYISAYTQVMFALINSYLMIKTQDG